MVLEGAWALFEEKPDLRPYFSHHTFHIRPVRRDEAASAHIAPAHLLSVSRVEMEVGEMKHPNF
jgi:hypothetical protein